jgi:hypothetical protein
MNEFNDIASMEEEIIWNDIEMKEMNTIMELSRQLRTFLKYKEKVIKLRFRSSFTSSVTNDVTKFMKKIEKLYDIAHKFIEILKSVTKYADSIEQGIQYQILNPHKSSILQLIDILKKLSTLIHYFSEYELHDHLDSLKLIIKLAREVCKVKKYLDFDLEEFYTELELNYEGLEEELEDLISNKAPKETVQVKKRLTERVRS